MRAAMSNRAKSVLREMITAEDAASMMRLVLLDAGEGSLAALDEGNLINLRLLSNHAYCTHMSSASA